jgi:hypothetical protein
VYHKSLDFDHNRNGVINPLCKIALQLADQTSPNLSHSQLLDSTNDIGELNQYDHVSDDDFEESMYQDVSSPVPATSMEHQNAWLEESADSDDGDDYLEVGDEDDLDQDCKCNPNLMGTVECRSALFL